MSLFENGRFVVLATSLALLAPLLLTPGCGAGEEDAGGTTPGASQPAGETAPPPPPGETGAAPAGGDAPLVAAGQKVFQANGCGNCHAVGGQGGGQAPDLTNVGADPAHTPEWLVAHVKDPKAHNPGSKMPSFEGKISDEELLSLGAYLASLK